MDDKDDPVFAELHNTHSYNRQGGGVFVTPTSSTDQCLMCIIDMKKEPLERVSILEPDISYDNNSTTNIVNGLICFYHNSYEKRRIYLYNLTTHESISLPSNQVEDSLKQFNDFPPVFKYLFNFTSRESTSLPWNQVEDSPKCSSVRFSRTCLLGFDPINKEYKVLHFSSQGENHRMKCQVFTIGGQRKVWRPLDASRIQGFNYFTSKGGFCMDGFLYWTEENGMIIFDVGLETFKLIDFPEKNVEYWLPSTVVKVDGYLFLVDINSRANIWWRLKEEEDTDEPQWTKEVAIYGNQFLTMDTVSEYNHLGQTFLARSLCGERSIIDYYDLVAGEHLEFEVKNPRGILGACVSFRVTEVIDNIMPLRNVV
ncbi:putative F-box protein At1g55070 isoform X2 [Silene latifolia]|uniref:putative F-box protein At1g55070 isoform X2 n=1 Tax=Silene latifolia TaxID=37657 RepID=UPI003D7765D0